VLRRGGLGALEAWEADGIAWFRLGRLDSGARDFSAGLYREAHRLLKEAGLGSVRIRLVSRCFCIRSWNGREAKRVKERSVRILSLPQFMSRERIEAHLRELDTVPDKG